MKHFYDKKELHTLIYRFNIAYSAVSNCHTGAKKSLQGITQDFLGAYYIKNCVLFNKIHMYGN